VGCGEAGLTGERLAAERLCCVGGDFVFAGALGGIHGFVGVGEEGLPGGAEVGCGGSADADGEGESADVLPAEEVLEAVGELDGFGEGGAGEEDGELLAADAGCEIAGADGGGEGLADEVEGGVSGGVAELIVAELEVVDVQDEDGEGGFVALPVGELDSGAGGEDAAVGEAGKGVGRGEEGELGAGFGEGVGLLELVGDVEGDLGEHGVAGNVFVGELDGAELAETAVFIGHFVDAFDILAGGEGLAILRGVVLGLGGGDDFVDGAAKPLGAVDAEEVFDLAVVEGEPALVVLEPGVGGAVLHEAAEEVLAGFDTGAELLVEFEGALEGEVFGAKLHAGLDLGGEDGEGFALGVGEGAGDGVDDAEGADGGATGSVEGDAGIEADVGVAGDEGV